MALKHNLKDVADPPVGRVTEGQLRSDLAALYRICAHHGWDDLLLTHISARIPGDHDHFLINPFGLLFSEITPESLVKVDMDGVVLDDTPYQINPAGFTIHSAIHMARPDVGCVLHLHTDAGIAVSVLEDPLPMLSQHHMQVGQVACHDYEGIAVDLDERQRIVKDLGEHDFLILRNHGTLTVGHDVAGAYLRMYFLEKCCRITLQVGAQGGRTIQPSEAAVTTVARQMVEADFFDGMVAQQTFEAVRRTVCEDFST